jgi:thioredoxin 1
MNRTHICFSLLLSCVLLCTTGCTPNKKKTEVAAACPAQEPIANTLQEGSAVVTPTAKPAINEIKTPLAFEELFKQNRPCVVKFSATWCGPCRYMKPLFEKEANQYCNQILFAEVDADEKGMEAIIGKYASHGFPTFVYFDKNGAFVKDHPGAYPGDEFAIEIKAFAAQYR